MKSFLNILHSSWVQENPQLGLRVGVFKALTVNRSKQNTFCSHLISVGPTVCFEKSPIQILAEVVGLVCSCNFLDSKLANDMFYGL